MKRRIDHEKLSMFRQLTASGWKWDGTQRRWVKNFHGREVTRDTFEPEGPQIPSGLEGLKLYGGRA